MSLVKVTAGAAGAAAGGLSGLLRVNGRQTRLGDQCDDQGGQAPRQIPPEAV